MMWAKVLNDIAEINRVMLKTNACLEWIEMQTYVIAENIIVNACLPSIVKGMKI